MALMFQEIKIRMMMMMNMRKKIVPISKFFKNIFLLAPRICLVFDKGAHFEANLAEICIFLTKVLANLAGKPLILSLVKQLRHRKQKAPFSRRQNSCFSCRLSRIQYVKGSDLFNNLLLQCHTKRFINKRLYILPKDLEHSYFPLNFKYILFSFAFENCQELKLIL